MSRKGYAFTLGPHEHARLRRAARRHAEARGRGPGQSRSAAGIPERRGEGRSPATRCGPT
jgi:hypothetical protein